MSRSTTPASDDDRRRDSGEMLFIGQRCAHDACSLVDFLPLKSTNPGEDPNIVMNRHIQRECQGARTKRDEIRALKARKDKGEVCWKKNCTKVLVVKIKSLKASTVAAFSKYSLRNNLAKTTSSATSSSSTTTPSASLLTPSGNPRKDAAIAAIKRSLQKKSEAAPTSEARPEAAAAPSGQGKPTLASVMQSFKSGSSPTLSKEARAELESQFRSMENRYKKGILSASDKVRYAQMCAERESARRNGLINKNDQCIRQYCSTMTLPVSEQPKILVEDAVEADLPEILEIYNYAILKTTSQWDYKIHSLEQRKEWFQSAKKAGYPVIVVRETGDPTRRILGWGCLGSFHAKEGYQYTVEDSIYVGENCQGKGIGKTLLSALIARARDMGMKTMVAEIEAGHAVSIKMHAKEGFVEAGRLANAGYKFDRWLDLLIMQLML
ncbi:hypothetical protein QFC22_005340 [Naganishia vaughanmartiniae]|uniref:Uncharacterized protein n=1 Tax=Naganishia vaughanmartiniae TaxID=1424756 RepID=A0ACC2WTP9_9TREE|nr:hypothetical protein QFC22_005340 [Naganishia vaughanmartiniae]